MVEMTMTMPMYKLESRASKFRKIVKYVIHGSISLSMDRYFTRNYT